MRVRSAVSPGLTQTGKGVIQRQYLNGQTGRIAGKSTDFGFEFAAFHRLHNQFDALLAKGIGRDV